MPSVSLLTTAQRRQRTAAGLPVGYDTYHFRFDAGRQPASPD